MISLKHYTNSGRADTSKCNTKYSKAYATNVGLRHGRPQKKSSGGGQKHSQDGNLSESYSQVSVSDRVTN